jgi:hypothetical protein
MSLPLRTKKAVFIATFSSNDCSKPPGDDEEADGYARIERYASWLAAPVAVLVPP